MRQAKADADDFASKTYNPKIKLDAKDAQAAIAKMKADLASLKNVNLKIAVAGSTQKLNTLSSYADALDGKNITMDVRLNGIADANAQLRTLRQQVNALDGTTINIRTDVDTSAAMTQIAALRTQLDGLNNTNTRVTASTNTFGNALKKAKPGMQDLVAFGMSAAPALIPIAGYLLNIAGAAASLGALTAISVIPFAGAMYGAIQNVTGLNKTLTAAKKALDTQRAALNQLTPGTNAYAAQLAKVEQAQDKVNAANAAFSPTQKKFSDGVQQMTGAWHSFIQATESVTLPVATTFVSALTNALPKAVPAVKAMAPEMQAIADSIKGWVDDGGFQNIINMIVTQGVPAFHSLRLAAVDVITLLGNGFAAFLPQASTLADVIKRGADNLAKWSTTGGFQTFISGVQKNAPTIENFFSNLLSTVGHVYTSLGNLSGVSLKFVTVLLKMVNALPPSVIQALYVGFIAYRAAVLGYAIAMGIASVATIAFQTASSPFFLLIAGAGLTILAVVAAVAALGVGIYELVQHWSTVQGALVTGWNATWGAIKTAVSTVYNSALKPAFSGLETALHGVETAMGAVGNAAVFMWNNGIKQTFSAIEMGAKLLVVIVGTILITPLLLGFRLLSAGAKLLWNNGLKQTFSAIATGAKFLYTNGIQPQINGIVLAFKTLGKWGSWLWNNGIKPYFNDIKSGADTVKNGAVTSFNGVVTAFKTVGKWAVWLWDNALHPAWNAIVTGTKYLYNNGIKPQINGIVDAFQFLAKWGTWLWDTALKPVWDRITSGTSTLKKDMIKAFTDMKNGIGGVWKELEKLAADPINFVIKNVYNNGIVEVWNGIASAVGLKGKNLSKEGLVKYDQGGAITGANVGMDTKQILARPGEHIWTADEVANAGGHNAVARLRAGYSSSGSARVAPANSARYADGGGILGGIEKIGGDALSGVSSLASKVTNLARGALGSALNPILDAISSGATRGINALIPGSPNWQDLADGVVTNPVDWIKTYITGSDKKYASSIGGKIPSGQHKSIIDSALAAAGVPPPGTMGQWETGLNTLIGRESGWNAGAVNRTDSNAAAGHPSQGLAQTIPSTFNHYVPSSLRSAGILNPVANVAAAIRYIVSRYGNITKVQQANANLAPKGYFGGGVPMPGLALTGEKGPELVATSGNSRVFTAGETSKMLNGSGGSQTLTGTLEISGPLAVTVDGHAMGAYVEGKATATLNKALDKAARKRK